MTTVYARDQKTYEAILAKLNRMPACTCRGMHHNCANGAERNTLREQAHQLAVRQNARLVRAARRTGR
jgi:hypothetical protein